MATTNGNRGNSDYAAATSSSQDAQPSPLAMLAATCSKIGSPAQSEEQGYGQGGDSSVRVVGAGQGGSTTDAMAGWMQLSNGTIVNSAGKPINNVIQQATLSNNVGGQLFSQGQQIVATQGPNGQLTYSVMPSYQAVNIDGQDAFIQEAFIIPSSGGQAQHGLQQAQQTMITPSGQIIRTQGIPAASAPTNLFQHVSGLGGLGNFINIGGNLISLGGVQNAVRQNGNIMQAVQIPGFQTIQQMPNIIQVPVSINGQTVLQTIQLPAQNIPIQTHIQQVGGGGLVSLGTTPQSIQTFMATQAQNQAQQAMAVAQAEESQNHAQSNQKLDLKPNPAQLNITNTSQASKMPGLTLASNNSGVQTLNVINTPQGQVILSQPANQNQVSLPTLTVPSYPQTITASSGSSTTTSTSTQNSAMLQNVLAQQQLLQGMANAQSIGGIQLTNQGQINWLPAFNMQAPRAPGVQTVQLQNLQGLQNIQAFPALHSLQSLQGMQPITQQGHLINNGSMPNLGTVAIGTPGGTISAIPLNTQQNAMQVATAALGQQGVLTSAQIQQDPNDPTKWQLVNSIPQTTSSVSVGTTLSVESPSANAGSGNESTPSGRRVRRVACTCPNCISSEKHVGGENKKKQHICHIENCGKVYGKTSHLRAHLRWHSGDRPFVCGWLYCGKRFTRSDELQRHKRTHTGEKKFQCPECSKRFMRSDHLTKHIKTHSVKRMNGDSISSTQGLDMDNQMDGGEDDEEMDEDEENACVIDTDTKVFRVSLSGDEEEDGDNEDGEKLDNLVS
ncbi:unnamed protein product [Lymnaea stagnalis]|uniref:C2H2-type domain-containing protein n=1 Tax=Lymnaea stagnalis TaxID=6523 RepID=A0AAV2H5S0_LYMST